MARGRMISKAISLDEKVDALSDDTARLLFTWMIAHLDVDGRMYGDARLFLSIVAPRRNISLLRIEKYLMEFETQGLILRYHINGNTFLFSPNFNKHQPGLRKEKEAQSQIPPPPPDLLRSKGGVKAELLPPKRSISIKEKKYKRKEVEGTPASFDSYKEKLRLKYLTLDIDDEWERCQIWFRDNKRIIKSPSLTLGNWMRKAREIKQDGGQNGIHRRDTTETPEERSARREASIGAPIIGRRG